MLKNIVIVDYGMGNLHSIKKKLLSLNVTPIISSNSNEILNADKIILPGVGHFKKAMENLQKLNLIDVLNESVLTKKTPILGICLGMQLMANKSEEGNTEGFGWFNAEVVRFKVSNKIKYKVPHIGWNQIEKIKDSKLLNGIENLSEFYFVHSYHWQTQITTDILTQTDYEYKFVSSIEKNNIFGVQFHPEKSHNVGEKLLKNFVEIHEL